MSKAEDLHGLVQKIKDGIGEEGVSKIEDHLINLSTGINSLITKEKEYESELKQANGEARDKRLALNEYRRNSETKTQEFEDKIAELKKNNNNEELTAENERLRNFEKETVESQRSDFKSFVESVKDNAKFEKVASKFKLPTNDDGINFEGFAEMQYDDLKHNLSQMRDLKEIEYFDSAPGTQTSPPSGGKAQRGTDKSYNERMSKATTRKEITEVLQSEGVTK
jgi:hypothetical protein